MTWLHVAAAGPYVLLCLVGLAAALDATLRVMREWVRVDVVTITIHEGHDAREREGRR